MTVIQGRCSRGSCWAAARTALVLFLVLVALVYLFGGLGPAIRPH